MAVGERPSCASRGREDGHLAAPDGLEAALECCFSNLEVLGTEAHGLVDAQAVVAPLQGRPFGAPSERERGAALVRLAVLCAARHERLVADLEELARLEQGACGRCGCCCCCSLGCRGDAQAREGRQERVGAEERHGRPVGEVKVRLDGECVRSDCQPARTGASNGRDDDDDDGPSSSSSLFSTPTSAQRPSPIRHVLTRYTRPPISNTV